MEDDDEFIIPQSMPVMGVFYVCKKCKKTVFERKVCKNGICQLCNLKDSGMYM